MSLENENRLRHALHNEEVCKSLRSAGYHDWVVTTAFYSSLHFLRFYLFPREIDGELFRTFETYRRSKGKESPHNLLLDLVQRYAIQVAPRYKWLYDMAHKSRYLGYEVPPVIAETAVTHMEAIRNFCTEELGQSIVEPIEVRADPARD